MSTFPCATFPHARTLPAMPPCRICGHMADAPRSVFTCSCCGATCDQPDCPDEHRQTRHPATGRRIDEIRVIDLDVVAARRRIDRWVCDDCAIEFNCRLPVARGTSL